MKKQIKILILLIVIVILGIGGWLLFFRKEEKPQPNKEEITPLMYQITKDGSDNTIYLFGSIHLANLNEFTFPQYVIDAYTKSRYLACEADIIEYQKDTEKMTDMVMQMMYQDGSNIKDHLKDETYNKLIKLLEEKGMYSNLYEYYKPYFFESLLLIIMANDAKINTNSGIDNYFIMEAKNDNKTILEVESTEFQNNLLLSFSDELYDIMLEEAVDNYDDEVKGLQELYTAWKQGNKEKLLELSVEFDEDDSKKYTKEQIKLIEEYNKKTLDDRNIGMTNKLIEYFNNDYETFYMVGAAHVVGDKGIVHLLEKEGFTVTQIIK